MDPKMQMAQAMLGDGMAQQAAQQMQVSPEYQKYAIQMQMDGQQPLPPEQWMQQQAMRMWSGR